jgi:hypothetical protein
MQVASCCSWLLTPARLPSSPPPPSGNSGGPVLLGDRLAGIAFQSLVGAENTGAAR